MGETSFTRELTKQEVAEFREAFEMFDMDGGGMSHAMDNFLVSYQHAIGTIESHELRHVMNKLGENPSDDELEDMIRAVDLNVRSCALLGVFDLVRKLMPFTIRATGKSISKSSFR